MSQHRNFRSSKLNNSEQNEALFNSEIKNVQRLYQRKNICNIVDLENIICCITIQLGKQNGFSFNLGEYTIPLKKEDIDNESVSIKLHYTNQAFYRIDKAEEFRILLIQCIKQVLNSIISDKNIQTILVSQSFFTGAQDINTDIADNPFFDQKHYMTPYLYMLKVLHLVHILILIQ